MIDLSAREGACGTTLEIPLDSSYFPTFCEETDKVGVTDQQQDRTGSQEKVKQKSSAAPDGAGKYSLTDDKKGSR